jgi:hypothetical protein
MCGVKQDLPEINVNNGTSLFMDQHVLTVPIPNPKNMAYNTAHCDRPGEVHLRRMPCLQAMAKSFYEKESKHRGMSTTNLIETPPFVVRG